MPNIVELSRGAQGDIRSLLSTDKDSAEDILSILREAQESPVVFRTLFKAKRSNPPRYYYPCDFSQINFVIYRFSELTSLGIKINIIKPIRTKSRAYGYRIFYFMDSEACTAHILGIMHRSINYNLSSPLLERVQNDYKMLCK